MSNKKSTTSDKDPRRNMYNITKVTGIEKVVKKVNLNDSEGFNERREKINRMFPYRQSGIFDQNGNPID